MIVLPDQDISTCMINRVLWEVLRLVLLLDSEWCLWMVHHFGGLGALDLIDALCSVNWSLIRYQWVVIIPSLVTLVTYIDISFLFNLLYNKLIKLLLVFDFIWLFSLINNISLANYPLILDIKFFLPSLIHYCTTFFIYILVLYVSLFLIILLIKDISLWYILIIYI